MVKVLNREQGKRMWGGKSNVYGVSGGGTGGGDVDLSSYATMAWTKQNFVSIEYFRTLFKAFDSNDNEILPNNTTSVVDNIKAMVGLWTEQYLTALGNQSGGGGGTGAQYLNDLLDVQLTTPLTDGQALVYNATLQKWVNGAAGVNMTTVWNALAGSTNEQINASHLSTALSGYVTTSAISDMATQTWVGQQGFATQTWVNSNFITIAYFDRLFRAYNDSTLVSHNDTTTTIDNIKAMFGFWTDFYLSALGTGGISTVGISLSQLADVNVAGVTNGQVLSYNSTSDTWVPATVSGGGTDMSTVWANLAAATNEQINISHLTTALSGYATTSALGSYLPLTGGALSGMLTMNATLYMNTHNLYYERTFQTGASRHAEFGSPSELIYNSIGDPAIGFVNDGSAVGEQRFTFGIGWYGNFVGRTAFFNGFYKNGSSDQYVLLGGGGHKLLSEIGGGGNYLPLTGGTLTGNLQINSQGNYYNEGLRIHCSATSYFSSLIFCDSQNTGSTGTSTGTWSILNTEGSFFIQKYDSSTAVFCNVGNMWGLNTTTPSHLFEVNGALKANTIVASSACDFNSDVSIGTSTNIGNNVLTVYAWSNFRYNIYCSGSISCAGISSSSVISTRATGGNYNEGIRIHSNNSGGWGSIMLCGTDNSGDTGSSSTTWGIFNYIGQFYINKNSSSGETGDVLCNTNGNWGIATISPSYKLTVNGYVGASGYQYISDIREKNIVEDIDIKVMAIAQSPSFKFYWKDKGDNQLHIGTSAQYWQTILPESVSVGMDAKHTLSLGYGELALVSVIAIAKKVVSHEEQIRLLETRVSELEKENDKLKKLVA